MARVPDVNVTEHAPAYLQTLQASVKRCTRHTLSAIAVDNSRVVEREGLLHRVALVVRGFRAETARSSPFAYR